MEIFTHEEIRKIEEGLDRRELMEKAGRAVAKFLLGKGFERIDVVAGPGNNGGDGFVAAKELMRNGNDVRVYAGEIKARLAREMAKGLDILPMENFVSKSDGERADVCVDALFGTGLSRNVSGLYAEAIREINKYRHVTSIDIPSGIDGNGRVRGVAVMANETVVIGHLKTGVVMADRKYTGKIVVARIMPEFKSRIHVAKPSLPQRADESHKGSYGMAVVVGGSEIYTGAPAFAALSFLKSGGGVVWIATKSRARDRIAVVAPEAIVLVYEEVDEFLDILDKADVVVIGNGLGIGERQKRLVEDVLELGKRTVVDGDALRMLDLERIHGKCILTPHLGEFSSMTGLSVDEIMENRIGKALEFSESFPGVLVLKSNRTVVASNGEAWVNMTGSHWLATAGSGDVLAGMIAGFIGQGKDLVDAAISAVSVHGIVGELAKGPVLTRDIIDMIPEAMEKARNWKGSWEFA